MIDQYKSQFKLNDGRMFASDFKLLTTDTIVKIKSTYETIFTGTKDNIKET